MNRRTRWTLSAALVVVTMISLFVSPPLRNAGAQTAGTSGFTYKHVAGAVATTIVISAPGTLHTIVVNTAATTVTAYDNASACSGTVIATIGTATGTFTYDANLINGLCVATTGSGTDITVTVK